MKDLREMEENKFTYLNISLTINIQGEGNLGNVDTPVKFQKLSNFPLKFVVDGIDMLTWCVL
jgi:hypothetical protein